MAHKTVMETVAHIDQGEPDDATQNRASRRKLEGREDPHERVDPRSSTAIRYAKTPDEDAAAEWEEWCVRRNRELASANLEAWDDDADDLATLGAEHTIMGSAAFRIINIDVTSTTESRRTQSDTSIDTLHAMQGMMDLAELRRDGSNSFFSVFTPASWTLPTFLSGIPILSPSLSFMVFILCAIKSLFFRLDFFVISSLGVTSVFLSSQAMFDTRIEIDTGPFIFGVIFPVVFLISQNWGRREKATSKLASMRAFSVQIAMKVLTTAEKVEACQGPHAHLAEASRVERLRATIHAYNRVYMCAKIIFNFIDDVGELLPQDCILSGVRLVRIYDWVAKLQAFEETGILTQFILDNFEQLRTMRDFRTPWVLNYFCFLIGYASPAIMGPHFASIGCKQGSAIQEAEECGYGQAGAYLTSMALSIVLSSLLAIIKDLEDPFDFAGYDDVIVQWNLEYNALTRLIKERKHAALVRMGVRKEIRTDSGAARAAQDSLFAASGASKDGEKKANKIMGSIRPMNDVATVSILKDGKSFSLPTLKSAPALAPVSPGAALPGTVQECGNDGEGEGEGGEGGD